MTTTTQSVIDRVMDQANDPLGKRIKLPYLSLWLNEAQRLIAESSARPCAAYGTLALAQGSRQDLRVIDSSSSWVRLHELVCNGTTATGAVIRKVDRDALDSAIRMWRTVSPATAIAEYSQDERDAYGFDVFPPVPVGGLSVYAFYTKHPAPCCVLSGDGLSLATPGELIGVPDGFDIAMVEYALYRYFMKDASDPNNSARASAHQQAFQAVLGVTTNAAGGTGYGANGMAMKA